MTKWCQEHDQELVRLMSYLKGSAELVLNFALSSEDFPDLGMDMSVDSDWSGSRAHTER